MAVKKRARSEKDKQKRRDKILKTAWSLYEKADGRLPTVSEIADKSGHSKGTVYLYFQTKEEIFLELFVEKLHEWLHSVAESLSDDLKGISEKDLSKIITGYMVENPILLTMGSIVKGVLEENTNDKALLEVKLKMANILVEAGRLLRRKHRGISEKRATQVILWVYALIHGLWQLTTHPPQIQEMLKKTNIDVFEPEFSHYIVEAVAALLTGSLISPEEKN